MPLERNAALALVDAGYMPLSKYIEMFAGDVAADVPPADALDLGHHRTRPWSIPAHLVQPGA